MGKIVNHRINRSRNHAYAQYGDILYMTRRYGQKSSEDTWEPIEHIPRSLIISSCNLKSRNLTKNFDNAIEG